MTKNFGIDLEKELGKYWDEGVQGIRNCEFKFLCDKRWNDLDQIEGVEKVRFCAKCQTEVHFIDDAWDLALALDKDWCVAITRTLAITAKGFKSLNEPLLGSLVPANHGRKSHKP